MIAWLAAPALAQTYAFPSVGDFQYFYPTAYVDHGGVVDWNCDNLTYAGHHGNDFGVGGFAGMDAGRTITAAADGVVTATNDGEFDRCTTGDCAGGGGFGNYVYLEHPDGKTTIYGHMKQWSVLVSVGDHVTCGQPLGQVGSSGYSTGPHLHFEVRNPTYEDPFDGPCSAPPTYWTSQGVHGDLPAAVCLAPAPCEPGAALACGDAFSSDNDGAGSTSATWAYGCDAFVYTGPERTWTFRTGLDQPVRIDVTGLGADLDVHVLDDAACDGTGCVAASSNPDASDESVTFDAVADQEYVVVVDGWEGATSPFDLAVVCSPDPPPEETGAPLPTGDTGPGTGTGGTGTGGTGTGGTTTGGTSSGGTETLGGDGPGVVDHLEDDGCACAATPGGRGSWLVLALGLLTGRRRR